MSQLRAPGLEFCAFHLVMLGSLLKGTGVLFQLPHLLVHTADSVLDEAPWPKFLDHSGKNGQAMAEMYNTVKI